MKQASLIIACYAALILIGGIIGYVTAGSLPSILMSSIFTLLLAGCSILIWKGNPVAYDTAIALVMFLLLFFGYRFLETFKVAPAGIMILLSSALLTYLFKKKSSRKAFAPPHA